jgi:hypothetical protein
MALEQYLFDQENLAGEPEPGWSEHSYDAGGALLGLHFSNLFDQGADESGESYDLATGQPYFEPSEELVDMTIREVAEGSEDILGPVLD